MNTKVSIKKGLVNDRKVAYCNKLLLFWLPTCLGISYSTAWRFTFKPGARVRPPPEKIEEGTLRRFCQGRRERQLYATG